MYLYLDKQKVPLLLLDNWSPVVVHHVVLCTLSYLALQFGE